MRLKWLSRMSIVKKLMLASVVVLTVSCVVVSWYLIEDTEQLLMQNSQRQSEQEMASIVNHYVEELTKQYEVVNEIYNYTALNNYLNAGAKSIYDLYIQFTQTIAPWLEGIRSGNREMDMKIYLSEDYLSVASLTGGKLENLKNQEWYSVGTANEDTLHVVCARTHVKGYPKNAVIYYKNVWDSYRRDIQRVIVVSRSGENLNQSIIVQDARYYLIDPHGLIVSTNESEYVGRMLSEMLEEKKIGEEKLVTGEMVRINGSTYYVSHEPFEAKRAGINSGWSVLYLQYYDRIAEEIHTQVFQSVKLCALIIITALGVAICIAYNITSRLQLLMKKINVMGTGDFSTQISIYGTDEISQISDSFDNMRGSILKLMDERQRAYQDLIEYERFQRELMESWRDAEHQVLRAQINPHYLFNTLESIRMSFLVDQEKEASRIVRIFAESMRRYMDVDRRNASLEEELIYVGYYMEIQHFRLGDRITYIEQVAPDLLEEQIPCLVLQPLVENAINHGIDPKPEGGTVWLNVRREGEWVVAEVRDDGVGMTPECLSEIKNTLKAEKKGANHLGLWNINRRMILTYGEENGIHIESTAGKGTVITVRFMIAEEGGCEDV